MQEAIKWDLKEGGAKGGGTWWMRVGRVFQE